MLAVQVEHWFRPGRIRFVNDDCRVVEEGDINICIGSGGHFGRE